MDRSQAINISLLLPKHINELTINLNKELEPKQDNKITLSTTSYVPHITLLHACTNNMQELKQILQTIATEYEPMELEIQSFQAHLLSENKTTALHIKPNKKLTALRNTIFEHIKHLLFQKPTKDMFAESVNDLTVDWVKNYPLHELTQFNPHITVGFGKTKSPGLPIVFTADTLAMSHLGMYCGCFKVLYSRVFK